MQEEGTKGHKMTGTVGRTMLLLLLISSRTDGFIATISPFGSRYFATRTSRSVDARPYHSLLLANKSTPDKDDDDGWGFDIDDDVLADLEKDDELNSAVVEVEERDLFIPIFALVALGGLMGAYGYEMLRLFLHGELFLPYIH
jgi:hypothetical protein